MIESMEMAELYRYKEGDEERIIGLLEEHGEDGISAFALCTQLGIKFQPLNVMVERLQRNGQARMVRRKSGAIYWYPDDKPPAAPIPDAAPLEPSPAPAKQATPKPAKPGRKSTRSSSDVRSCPLTGCPSEFKGVHSRKSLINHLVKLHDIELGEAKSIADGKLEPQDMDKWDEYLPKEPISAPISDPVDADIIPPSEAEIPECVGGACRIEAPVELEHFQAWDGPRVRFKGEAESVAPTGLTADLDGDALCVKPAGFVDLQESDTVFIPLTELQVKELQHLSETKLQYAPMPRPAPGPRDIPNTCTPLEVRHVTIPTTERPQDEPTPLARICTLAVEMEALAARHGYSVQVDIDTYVGAAPQIQLRARRMGAIE